MPRSRPQAAPHPFPPDQRVFRSAEFFSPDFPFAITRVRLKRGQFEDESKRQREFWKLTLILEGSGKALVNEREYPLGPGSVFLVHPHDWTSYRIASDELVVYNLLFLPELFNGELDRLSDHYAFFCFFDRRFDPSAKARGGRGPSLPPSSLPPEERDNLFVFDKGSREFLRDAEFLESEARKKAPLWHTVVRHRLLEMLVRLSRVGYKQLTRSIRHRLADYIDGLIERHYDQPLHLDVLAAQVGLSKDRLGKRYKAERGRPILEALHRRRVERAAELLAAGGMTVTDVCHEVGFNDLSFFHRIYRRYRGVTPRETGKRKPGH